MIILILICLIGIIITGILYRYPIFKVCGISMLPTLEEGDIVIVDKKDKKLCIGSIYVYTPPDKSREFVIKRLVGIKYFPEFDSYGLWFEGDNKENSIDSRKYGYVNIENVKGKVIKIIKKRGRN